MRSQQVFLRKSENASIRDNCADSAVLPAAVQDLAELLAEIAAQRLMNKDPAASKEPEKQ